MKKTLKKCISIILVSVMMISIVACGSSSETSSEDNEVTNNVDSVENGTTEETQNNTNSTYNLTFSSINPGEDNKYAVVTRAWFNSITDATDGAITFDEYYNSTANEAEDALSAVRDGIVDIAEYYSTYWGDQFTLWDLFNMPFQYEYPDGYQYSHAMAEMIQIYPEFIEQVESKGVHFVLAHGDAANQLLSNTPVYSIDDIQGMIINVSSTVDQELLESLGASVEIFSPADVYDNVSKGVIDAFMTAYQGSVIWSTYDVASYATNIMGTHATWLYLMNNETYNNLPDEYKAYFDIEYTDDFMVALGYQFYQDETIAQNTVANYATIIDTDEVTDYDEWVAAADVLYQNWIDNVTAEGYNGEGMYETWKSLLEKYSVVDWTGEKEWLESYDVTVPDTWIYD